MNGSIRTGGRDIHLLTTQKAEEVIGYIQTTNSQLFDIIEERSKKIYKFIDRPLSENDCKLIIRYLASRHRYVIGILESQGSSIQHELTKILESEGASPELVKAIKRQQSLDDWESN